MIEIALHNKFINEGYALTAVRSYTVKFIKGEQHVVAFDRTLMFTNNAISC